MTREGGASVFEGANRRLGALRGRALSDRRRGGTAPIEETMERLEGNEAGLLEAGGWVNE